MSPKGRKAMKTLSIVIPVFNEEKRLTKTFEALKSLPDYTGLTLNEVIFVNDGSYDRTLLYLKRFAQQNPKLPVQIISHARNSGKGYAVRTGMMASASDYALLADADISTPFSELRKFLIHIENRKDVMVGTRKNGHSTVIVHQPPVREFLGRCFTIMTKTILRLEVHDITCGFKLFSKKAVNTIFPDSVVNRWGYDAEILYLAQKRGLRVAESAVLWSDDKNTHVTIKTAIPQTLLELVIILSTHSNLAKYIPPSVIKQPSVAVSKLGKLVSAFF